MLSFYSTIQAFKSLLEPLHTNDQQNIFYQFIIEPMNSAVTHEERLLSYAAELVKKANQLTFVDSPIKTITELTDFHTGKPFLFRRKDLIAIALNVGDQGSESNFETMLEGYRWKKDDVIAVLDRHLTEQEWLFVSAVFGVYRLLLPEVECFYLRSSGVRLRRPCDRYFKPCYFDINIGGYYPQMYDLDRSTIVQHSHSSEALLTRDYVFITPPCQRRIGQK
jgi:hypothetical protein